MDIDYLKEVAQKKVPFDLNKGMAAKTEAEVYFVATRRSTGKPEYMEPRKEDWLDVLVASC